MGNTVFSTTDETMQHQIVSSQLNWLIPDVSDFQLTPTAEQSVVTAESGSFQPQLLSTDVNTGYSLAATAADFVPASSRSWRPDTFVGK